MYIRMLATISSILISALLCVFNSSSRAAKISLTCNVSYDQGSYSSPPFLPRRWRHYSSTHLIFRPVLLKTEHTTGSTQTPQSPTA